MATVKTTPVQGGAQYAMVHERVKAFCARYENGQILTEIVKDEQGHVIFKAHAVVDGLIRGTGHAHELEGSSNINNTSHYEACETSAVGRALAMMGYSPDGSLASFEEIENAKLQQSNIITHQKMMETTVAILGHTFREAIDNDDEAQIVECRKDMHGNEPLRQAINKTLSNEQVQYLVDRQTAITEAKKIKSAEKHQRNVEAASNLAKKNSEV